LLQVEPIFPCDTRVRNHIVVISINTIVAPDAAVASCISGTRCTSRGSR
jgi:hypothetical protein